MKIALFSATLPPYPCGVGKHTYFLANALQQAGHTVNLVTLQSNQSALSGQFSLQPSLAKFGLWEYLRWAVAHRGVYDMVHLQYPTKLNRRGFSVIFLPWIFRLFRIPATLTLHELSEASLLGKIRNIALATGFSRIILPNPQDAIWLPHKKASIHHIGLGPTLVRASPQSRHLDGYSLGFLGFMDGSKGEQDLLQALTAVKTNVKVYLLTAFQPQTNPFHAQLRDFVQAHKLQDMVEWVSPATDQHILDYLEAVDVVVLPFKKGVTRRNSTLLEALAAGKPIIVSDAGYMPDYLQPDQNCLTVPPGQPHQLAAVIDRLAGDAKLQQHLAHQAKGLADQFDWATIAQQTQKVYTNS